MNSLPESLPETSQRLVGSIPYVGLFSLLCLTMVSVTSIPSTVSAQTSGVFRSLGRPQTDAMRDITGILSETKTKPLDDAVLQDAPSEISFDFPETVRLVKLIVRDQKRGWVDIGFRYNPAPDSRFVWSLPSLAESTYYTADWAILATNDRLVKGSLSFAFGPDAEPPSVTKESEELLRLLQSGSPSIELNEALQPTEIIINRDPEVYDPPFTIQLNN